jgi:hypothetical protein
LCSFQGYDLPPRKHWLKLAKIHFAHSYQWFRADSVRVVGRAGTC